MNSRLIIMLSGIDPANATLLSTRVERGSSIQREEAEDGRKELKEDEEVACLL